MNNISPRYSLKPLIWSFARVATFFSLSLSVSVFDYVFFFYPLFVLSFCGWNYCEQTLLYSSGECIVVAFLSVSSCHRPVTAPSWQEQQTVRSGSMTSTCKKRCVCLAVTRAEWSELPLLPTCPMCSGVLQRMAASCKWLVYIRLL